MILFCFLHVILLASATVSATALLPTPTAVQLRFQDAEIGALVQWNIGIFGEETNNYACSHGVIPAANFAPGDAAIPDVNAWARTARDMGAEHAVLTAQAGCGFLLWPTNATLATTGETYPYTTRAATHYRGDIDLVGSFVDACRKVGVRPGIYYQIANNVYCNVSSCVIGENSPCGNQAQYENLVLAQIKELWSNYGQLAELWFDGGVDSGSKPTPGSLSYRVASLMAKLQPDAVGFQAPGNVNGIRWAGSEQGTTSDDTWSTSVGGAVDFGPGSPKGKIWAPVECDVTLQANGEWYWQKGVPLRTLAELATIHDGCVGHNGNLLLAVHPTLNGTIDPMHDKRGREFAAWRKACYGEESRINGTNATQEVRVNTSIVIALGAAGGGSDPTVNRLVVEEAQGEGGQKVRGFEVDLWNLDDGTWVNVLSGASIGHKRIVNVGGGMAAEWARLTITKAAPGVATVDIRSFAAFTCDDAPPTVN